MRLILLCLTVFENLREPAVSVRIERIKIHSLLSSLALVMNFCGEIIFLIFLLIKNIRGQNCGTPSVIGRGNVVSGSTISRGEFPW